MTLTVTPAAGNRRLINALLSAVVVAGFASAAYVLHQEQRIQQMERRP